MKNWRKIKSKEIFASKYFRVRADECETFDNRVMPRYYVMDFPDWVQVVAFDAHGKLICVEQYRYPGQGWFLEFPGGSSHPDRNEEALDAAKRELREETGHESDNWEYAGFHHPNPALMSNRCQVFIARDCRLVGDLNLDPFEDLKVRKMSYAEFEREIAKSEFRHSLMLATMELVRGKV